jgi:hypothetical protein
LRALAKAPAGRFPSVAKLHEALAAWAEGARSLEDAAAVQVMARAAESRKMKQAAGATPDATAPMPKIDLAGLAHATRQDAAELPQNKRMGNGSMNEMSTRKDPNPNSPESVEASLEDFISQANASFPTSSPAGSDGWDLHTGDVELVDDDENVEADSEPIVKARPASKPATKPAAKVESKPAAKVDGKPAAKPNVKAQTAANLIKRADQSGRGLKASLEEPTPLPPPHAAEVTPAPRRRNPFEAVTTVMPEPEPLGPPPTGPKHRAERTEVVSSPLPRVAPWTSSPLMWVGGVVAAFVLGAGLVFVMVRTMMPSQPIVVQAPPPVVVHDSDRAPQPAKEDKPVVTSLAKQPVVTPLGQPAAGEPKPLPEDIGMDAATVSVDKGKAAAHHKLARPVMTAAVTPAARPAPVAKATAKKAPKTTLPDEGDDDDSAPAAAAARPAPAKVAAAAPAKKAAGKKEAKPKGGDWVDPFAQ